MPTNSQDTPRSLPEQPNLRHLKAQAKDLFKAGEAASLTDAQFKPGRGTALDYLIGTYARSPQLTACIDLLLEAGGVTKYDAPGVLDLLRGDWMGSKRSLMPTRRWFTNDSPSSIVAVRGHADYYFRARRCCMWRRSSAMWKPPGCCLPAGRR
jgi:hypothetical protein